MSRSRFLLPFVCALYLATAANAAGPIQSLFGKKPKPDPVVHVPALIATLATDKDEKARAEAADELKNFDGKQFPDILPALTHALANDGGTSVRLAAANSIGKLRPISQEAGYALEQAASNDSVLRVRVAAKTTLLTYNLLGYISGRSADPKLDQSEEPPLAEHWAAKMRAPKAAPPKEAPKPATPTKNESKRDWFTLPNWFGTKDKEPAKNTGPVLGNPDR